MVSYKQAGPAQVGAPPKFLKHAKDFIANIFLSAKGCAKVSKTNFSPA